VERNKKGDYSSVSDAQAARDAYEAAMRSGDPVQLMRGKVMLVGDGGHGKSSTMRSLLREPFVAEHISTVVGEVHQVTTRGWLRVADEVAYDLKTVGNRMAAHRIKGKSNKTAKLLRMSLQHVKEKAVQVTRTIQGASVPQPVKPVTPPAQKERPSVVESDFITTVANDKFDEKLVNEEMENEAPPLTLMFYDFGGQAVFHTLHHLFLTRYGVYLVIFDMRKLLNDEKTKAMEEIEFWLRSINAHAPGAHIFLVGTHHDIVNEEDDLETIDEMLLNLGIEENESIVRGPDYFYFPLDNRSTNANRAQNLQIEMEKVFRNEKYIKDLVPSRWIRALAEIEQLKPYADKVTQVYPLCEKHQVPEKEWEQMLEFFHRLGIILYLTNNETLSERIVTDPKWLMSSLGKVIRDKDLHFKDKAEKKAVRDLKLLTPFNELKIAGFVSKPLFDFFYPVEKDQTYLMQLMEVSLLMCKWKTDVFLVPSLAPVRKDPSKSENGSVCYLQFDYLPGGLFERLVCICVADMQTEFSFEPIVFKNFARIGYLETVLQFECDRKQNRIYVAFSSQKNFVRIRQVVERLVQLIQRDFLGDLQSPSLWIIPRAKAGAGVKLEDLRRFISLNKSGKIGVDGGFVDISEFQEFIDLPRGLESTFVGRFDAFFSHAWGANQATHDFILEVYEQLGMQQPKMKVWLDEHMMAGNLSASMAKGIDQSEVVVVFITEEYVNKVNQGTDNNCWKEFNYAVGSKHGSKRIIPVVLEKQFLHQKDSWTGQFGMDIDKNQMFIDFTDFTDKSKFEKQVRKLANEICSRKNKLQKV